MINNLVKEIFGTDNEIKSRSGTSGGCINNSFVLRLKDGRSVFVKQNSLSFREMFKAEAHGLKLLASAKCIRVPDVIAVKETDREQFLFLENIESSQKQAGFFRDFGEKLAMLHSRKLSKNYGLDIDNYIGSSEQKNTWYESWTDFFANERLLFQLHLAKKRGRETQVLEKQVLRIASRIGELLPEPDHPSLLHGDLWGGNYMADEKGQAVLIDPAAYYGHFEADLAMTELFGGFGRDFYDAYAGVLPIDGEYRKRKDLYNLYHILNHLNIFGSSYLSQCLSICSYYI